jgi:hypothetical protein
VAQGQNKETNMIVVWRVYPAEGRNLCFGGPDDSIQAEMESVENRLSEAGIDSRWWTGDSCGVEVVDEDAERARAVLRAAGIEPAAPE